MLPTLSFARILNLLEAACLDQWSQAEVRKHQKAWLRGEPLPTEPSEPSTAEGPRPLRLPDAPASEYVDPDGSMGQPLPGLRERPVGYGL